MFKLWQGLKKKIEFQLVLWTSSSHIFFFSKPLLAHLS